MANYVDVETSPEALQEDEELIEAVEAIVETAAASVKSQIAHEINTTMHQVQSSIETFFPIWVEYQKNPALLWQDLEHCAIFLALFVWAFWLLAPWRGRKNKSKGSGASAGNASMMIKKPHSKQLRRKSFGGMNRFRLDSNGSSLNDEMDSANNSINSLFERRLLLEEETDEERFARVYPSLHAESKYYKLLLPPQCQLVEKPKALELRQQQLKQQKAAKMKEQQQKGRVDAADDPVQRLQTYFRHFMGLVRSLFTFDYAGAAWTILLWLQGIREHRRTNSRTSLSQALAEQAADDDESEVVDLAEGDDEPPSKDEGGGDGNNEPESEPDKQKETDGGEEKRFDEEEENQTTATISTAPPTPFVTPVSDGGVALSRVDGQTPRLPLLESSRNRKFKQHHHGSNKSLTSTSLSEEKKATSPIEPSEDPALDSGAESNPTRPALSFLKKRLPSFRRNHSSTSETETVNSAGADSHDVATVDTFFSSNESTPDGKGVSSASGRTVVTSHKAGSKSTITSSSRGVGDTDSRPTSPSNPPDPSNLDNRLSSASWYFFETAQSKESIKQMSLEVPVPDKNGYVLGDDYLPSDRCTPLLVFVNSRSGPQQGHLLITQLRRLLNPIQIWDLAEGGPEPILESFLKLTKLRILVCGGDGTVSWIISALDSLKLKRKWPPIAILPLGTGNDLARVHGWGAGYNNESLITILEQVSESYISILDRWELSIEEGKKKRVTTKNFFNYFSFGVDAEAALQVHKLREQRPEWFFSRFVNKAWYGVLSAEESIKGNSVNVRREISLYADGVRIKLPADSQGIIILNIDSYAGGVPLWSYGVKEEENNHQLRQPAPLRRSQSLGGIGEVNGPLRFDRNDSSDDFTAIPMTEEERFERVTACDSPASCQDGLLEIVSVRGLVHLGQCKVGLGNAVRLGQCRELKIVIKKKVAVQIDGEPWRQDKCVLRIKRKKDPAIMLHRSADDSAIEMEMSKLLDWAEERQLIQSDVHSILMKEFSRRIESKTRQRRVRSLERNVIQNLKRAIGSTGAISSLGGSGGHPRPQQHLHPQLRNAQSERPLVNHNHHHPTPDETRRTQSMIWGQGSFSSSGGAAIAF